MVRFKLINFSAALSSFKAKLWRPGWRISRFSLARNSFKVKLGFVPFSLSAS